MMFDPACCTDVGQLLSDEQALVERLASALQDEHGAMVARDSERLEHLVGLKQQVLQQLEEGHQRRLVLLQRSGLASDKAGFSTLLEQCADAGHDHGLAWEQLKSALQDCQKQNEINGKVLESGRRVIHNTLSILMGGQGEAAELYTQEGKSSPSKLGGHTVAKV